jgi:hypothetical protein
VYFPRFVDAVYRCKGSGLALNADAFQQDPCRHASLFGSTTARQFSWLAFFASPQVLLALVAVFREKVAHHDTRRKRPTAARRRNHVARTWRGGCTSSLFREVRAITTGSLGKRPVRDPHADARVSFLIYTSIPFYLKHAIKCLIISNRSTLYFVGFCHSHIRTKPGSGRIR